MKIIGLEEHFVTPEVQAAWKAVEPRWQDQGFPTQAGGDIERRLLDFGTERLAQMDETGMDVQVLSLTTPATQSVTADAAVGLARDTNDQLAAAIAQHPDRLQGFATLPTPNPQAAAKELERAVTELGMQGAMVCGRTRDRNFDLPEFWPIFEAAAALRAPLYFHPQVPQQEVTQAYYRGFNDTLDGMFSRPGIGWHYETGIQIVRLILAGVFDKFPDLRIVTGHWGEVVLFYLERLDMMNRATGLPRKVSEYFRDHVYVTPSGLFSQRYLRWAMEVLGPDHILMSADYPYVPQPKNAVRNFLQGAALNDEDKTKIASGNWERLCGEIRR